MSTDLHTSTVDGAAAWERAYGPEWDEPCDYVPEEPAPYISPEQLRARNRLFYKGIGWADERIAALEAQQDADEIASKASWQQWISGGAR